MFIVILLHILLHVESTLWNTAPNNKYYFSQCPFPGHLLFTLTQNSWMFGAVGCINCGRQFPQICWIINSKQLVKEWKRKKKLWRWGINLLKAQNFLKCHIGHMMQKNIYISLFICPRMESSPRFEVFRMLTWIRGLELSHWFHGVGCGWNTGMLKFLYKISSRLYVSRYVWNINGVYV